MVDVDRRSESESADDRGARIGVVGTEEDRVIDVAALHVHRSVRVHCEEAEVEGIAEAEAVEGAQIGLQSATEDVVAVVLDARVARRVADRPDVIEAMLEQAAARPLRAVEEVVARLADKRVDRDLSVRVRKERALRRQELAPAGVVFLVIALNRPGGLLRRIPCNRGGDEPAIVGNVVDLCVAVAIETC